MAAGLAALLALLLAEGLHRLWASVGGNPHDAVMMAEQLKMEIDLSSTFTPGKREDLELNSEVSRRDRDRSSNLLHPYAGSEREHDSGGVLAAFREGLPEGSLKILVVGGSVASGYAQKCQEEAQGPTLAAALASDPRFPEERTVVLNYAHSAYKQPQQVTRLAYLLSFGFRPDVVVNIDGFNEIAASYKNAKRGVNPAYPSGPVWGLWLTSKDDRESVAMKARLAEMADEKRAFGEWFLGNGLNRSSLLTHWALSRVRSMNREGARIQEALGSGGGSSPLEQRQVGGPDFDPDRESVLELSSRIWFESSLSLQALCSSRDIPYVHVLQPALNENDRREVTRAEEKFRGGADAQSATRDGYRLLTALGEALLGEGVIFIDATRCFDDLEGTIYKDQVHFNRDGHVAFSREVERGIRQALAN